MGKKTIRGVILICILAMTLPSLAQSNDPNDPSSPNYKKSVTKQVKDRWMFSVMGQTGRAMQEFSETYMYYAVTGTYLLDKGSLTFTADYSHPLDLDTPDKDPWELGDPSVTYNSPSLFGFKFLGQDVNVVSRVSYLAPVSSTSQDTSSYGMLVGTLNAVASTGRFTFIASPSLLLSYHGYETADEFGFSPNYPVMARLGGTVRAQIWKNLSATATGYMQNAWAYQGQSILIQGMSSNLIYQVRPDTTLLAFVSWRDRMVTTNSLFDDDTVQTGLGLIYMF